MGDFLGNGNIATVEKKYLSYEEARAFVHKLKLKNYPEWRIFTKTKEMPKDIPNSPITVYKGKGWKDCGDWLGNGSIYTGIKGSRKYLPFDEAKAFVHTLNLSNVTKWDSYCNSDNKPFNIPSNPKTAYYRKGWVSYDDWLGLIR